MASLVQPPYSVKAIKQIRNIKKPSDRLTKKINDTYEYFLNKVDPIIGACITHLLCEQPADVPSAMISFFSNFQQGIAVAPNSCDSSRKPKKEMKLFLASNIAPIISKLVNRVAVLKPENVAEFMINELKQMLTESGLNADVPEVGVKSVSVNIQIAVVGLFESGKTSILNAMQGKHDVKARPTIGFRPISMALENGTEIKFYDLGGGKRIRDIWDQYYHDVHGVIYVVDAAAPAESMQECCTMMQHVLSHCYLEGKPLLVLANKQDLPDARAKNEVHQVLNLGDIAGREVLVEECIGYVDSEAGASAEGVSGRLEHALERLLQVIGDRFEGLEAKVKVDSKQKAIDEARKRIERERKVLRSKIGSAFIDIISPSVVETLQLEADASNVFDAEEGLKFLAAELGEDVDSLPEIAAHIAGMTGYQRLALQIVGALKTPISKKKVPMSWEEILQIVTELRHELGL